MKVALFFTLLAVALVACPGCDSEADLEHAQALHEHYESVRCALAAESHIFPEDC